MRPKKEAPEGLDANVPDHDAPDLNSMPPGTLSRALVRGHLAMPYEWGVEPVADRKMWPAVPRNCTRVKGSVWGLCQPKSPPWRGVRNDITRIMSEEYVPISPATRQPEGDYGTWLQLHQIRVLNHIFTPRSQGVGKAWRLPYHTMIYSDLKKSGKTGIGGALLYAWARVYGGELYGLANSKDHAVDRGFNRLVMFLRHLQRTEPERYEREIESITGEQVVFRAHDTAEHYQPYCEVNAVPVAASSQAGGFQSVTLWDELWGYEHDSAVRMFSEMQPISTIPDAHLPTAHMIGTSAPHQSRDKFTVSSPSMRIIVTYAGYHGVSDLLYQLYKQCLLPDDNDNGRPSGYKADGLEDLPCYVSPDGGMLAYWNQDVPRMPWQSPTYYTQARNDPINLLRPEEYRRLHRNHWTNAAGAFLEMSIYDRNAAAGQDLGVFNNLAW